MGPDKNLIVSFRGPRGGSSEQLGRWYFFTNSNIHNSLTFSTAVGEKRQFPHLRMLLRFVAWNEFMEFPAFEERISSLTELVTIQPQPLPFPQIREAALSIKGIQHGAPFRPSTYWGVKLYDVGYVRGEEFVFLLNSQDMSDLNYTSIIMEDEFITSPDVSSQIKRFGNGVCQWVRSYLFIKLTFADLGVLLCASDLNFTTHAVQLLTGDAIVKIWQIVHWRSSSF